MEGNDSKPPWKLNQLGLVFFLLCSVPELCNQKFGNVAGSSPSSGGRRQKDYHNGESKRVLDWRAGEESSGFASKARMLTVQP
ncbi:hypothetical protein MRB53_006727 [Persea americana]|uniref:Uncharacterized protein n=1 Tax=Persea americana TaxID=3435 RepID=A0ACC2MH00_PERAE|nr:hypothetical protein MRB53_006727 [Persea americana]